MNPTSHEHLSSPLSTHMVRRIEPELMTDPLHAETYAQADFSAAHQAVIEWITTRYGIFPKGSQVLDIGCGPGDITRRLLKEQPHIQITGIDGSEAMLQLARQLTEKAGLVDRASYTQGLIQELPQKLTMERIDLAISTSVLHHLEDPLVLWRTLSELQNGKAQIKVVVTDLLRPEKESTAHAIVERYAGQEHPALKGDFYNSLCAAFTLEEVRDQLYRAGQSELIVEALDELHLVVSGNVR